MSGYLTTHVLDTARGRPAAGLRIVLTRADDGETLTEATTNDDGRTDAPVMSQHAFAPGDYVLTFHAGDYLRGLGLAADFLDVIPIRFRMEAGHYHVPLLLSPYGYSTYRGS